ncbi:MAG: hypothetical protein Q7J42_03005 [Sulfuritalea sp.]|nr:hypothetical protein [Sulfuritalea sp.]
MNNQFFPTAMLGYLLFIGIVLAVIVLVCRELVCWYWKINQNVALLTEIRDLLAAKQSSQGVPQSQSALTTQVTDEFCCPPGAPIGVWREDLMRANSIRMEGDSYLWNGNRYPSFDSVIAAMREQKGQQAPNS